MSDPDDDLSEAAEVAPAGRRTRIALVLSLAYAVAVVLLVVDRTGAADASGSGPDGGGSTVVFTAAGASDDGGHRSRAELALAAGAGFHLSLGDLASVAPTEAWCGAAATFTSVGVPLQHLASSRELAVIDDPAAAGRCVPDVLDAKDADIARFAADLGDSVRLIGIAPGATVGGVEQSYEPGTELHGWLTAAIRSARAEPGRWVIVAMSEPCIDTTLCPEQRALIDTLLAERVDLVLAGGRTGYQRNRPIGTAAGCPPMALGDLRDVDEACLPVSASVARVEAGAGTLMLLVGTGGGELERGARSSEAGGIVAVSSADGELPARGLLVVTARDQLLVTELVGEDGEVRDRFTIDRRSAS